LDTQFGRRSGTDLESLLTEVAGPAIADAGLSLTDVDGIFVGVFNNADMQLPNARTAGVFNMGVVAAVNYFSVLKRCDNHASARARSQ
jgi:acetyl-CoA acetyltransferase